MTIPEKISTFEDEKALLLVTGKQIGKIYYATGQKISELETLEMPSIKFSDKEGFFARTGKGRTYGTGATQEPKDAETKKRFIRKLSQTVKELLTKKKVDTIYVFSPNYAIRELKEALPAQAKEIIRNSFMGNYVKFTPLDLIEKIDDRRNRSRERNQHLKEEEAKIMHKPRKTSSRLATT